MWMGTAAAWDSHRWNMISILGSLQMDMIVNELMMPCNELVLANEEARRSRLRLAKHFG